MAVKYYLDKRPNKTSDEVHIRVSISIRGCRLVSTVGYSIRPETWDPENQRVSPKFKTVNGKGATPKIVNDRLKAIRSHFDELDVRAVSKPSVEDLKNELAGITGSVRTTVGRKEEKNVLDRFQEFVIEESASSQWTPGTLQCWHAFSNHLAAQGKNLGFDHFDEQGITTFISYLRTSCQMRENTVRKHFSNLRWFLRWAIRKGYCNETAIQRITPKFKEIPPPIIFLTPEELHRLYNYKIPKNGEMVTLRRLDGEEYNKVVESAAALEKTRDLFCFCAFTSLRYSDMAKLKRSDIGKDTMSVTTKKTNDRLTIDLNDFAKAILKKYGKEKHPADRALPVISNQKMNNYLKDLCELCGISEPVRQDPVKGGIRTEEVRMKWELVGTKAARKTFISYAISKGIPPETVMKWTGHSDYKAMKPYLDIAESAKKEAMNTINEHLQTTLNNGEVIKGIS